MINLFVGIYEIFPTARSLQAVVWHCPVAVVKKVKKPFATRRFAVGLALPLETTKLYPKAPSYSIRIKLATAVCETY